jgi:hypothetical protein
MTFSFTEINTSNMVNYGCEFSALFEKKSSQRRVGTECLAGLARGTNMVVLRNTKMYYWNRWGFLIPDAGSLWQSGRQERQT